MSMFSSEHHPRMLPADIKTYTTQEAIVEWDAARESKRRMILARVDRRESDPASLKRWRDLSQNERKLVHCALNEDFISPVWYINTKGQRINLIDIPTVQKSPAQLADEEGESRWGCISLDERFRALLENGIGHDADQGQFARWSNLGPELRERLIRYFAARSADRHEAVIRDPEHNAAVLQPRTDPRQLSLF